MVSLAVEVQDVANMHHMFVVPSPRRMPSAKEVAAFVARLAPIEMATPTISSATRQHPPAQINDQLAREPDPGKPLSVQGWAIPLAYLACGLLLLLCSLLVPDGLVACAHVLVPPWTLTLALHALAVGDPTWLFLALLVISLLPYVLLLQDSLFLAFYLLVFAVFGSGRFWQVLQGPPFVLVCVAWFGLLCSCVLALFANHPRAQLSAAAGFALASAAVTSASRFGRLVLRAG